MKKLVLSLVFVLALTMSVTSCKENPIQEEEVTTTDTTTVVTPDTINVVEVDTLSTE